MTRAARLRRRFDMRAQDDDFAIHFLITYLRVDADYHGYRMVSASSRHIRGRSRSPPHEIIMPRRRRFDGVSQFLSRGVSVERRSARSHWPGQACSFLATAPGGARPQRTSVARRTMVLHSHLVDGIFYQPGLVCLCQPRPERPARSPHYIAKCGIERITGQLPFSCFAYRRQFVTGRRRDVPMSISCRRSLLRTGTNYTAISSPPASDGFERLHFRAVAER